MEDAQEDNIDKTWRSSRNVSLAEWSSDEEISFGPHSTDPATSNTQCDVDEVAVHTPTQSPTRKPHSELNIDIAKLNSTPKSLIRRVLQPNYDENTSLCDSTTEQFFSFCDDVVGDAVSINSSYVVVEPVDDQFRMFLDINDLEVESDVEVLGSSCLEPKVDVLNHLESANINNSNHSFKEQASRSDDSSIEVLPEYGLDFTEKVANVQEVLKSARVEECVSNLSESPALDPKVSEKVMMISPEDLSMINVKLSDENSPIDRRKSAAPAVKCEISVLGQQLADLLKHSSTPIHEKSAHSDILSYNIFDDPTRQQLLFTPETSPTKNLLFNDSPSTPNKSLVCNLGSEIGTVDEYEYQELQEPDLPLTENQLEEPGHLLTESQSSVLDALASINNDIEGINTEILDVSRAELELTRSISEVLLLVDGVDNSSSEAIIDDVFVEVSIVSPEELGVGITPEGQNIIVGEISSHNPNEIQQNASPERVVGDVFCLNATTPGDEVVTPLTAISKSISEVLFLVGASSTDLATPETDVAVADVLPENSSIAKLGIDSKLDAELDAELDTELDSELPREIDAQLEAELLNETPITEAVVIPGEEIAEVKVNYSDSAFMFTIAELEAELVNEKNMTEAVVIPGEEMAEVEVNYSDSAFTFTIAELEAELVNESMTEAIITPEAMIVTPEEGTVTPELEAETTEVDVITPEVDVITPEVDVITPEVDVITPDLAAVPQEENISPQEEVYPQEECAIIVTPVKEEMVTPLIEDFTDNVDSLLSETVSSSEELKPDTEFPDIMDFLPAVTELPTQGDNEELPDATQDESSLDKDTTTQCFERSDSIISTSSHEEIITDDELANKSSSSLTDILDVEAIPEGYICETVFPECSDIQLTGFEIFDKTQDITPPLISGVFLNKPEDRIDALILDLSAEDKTALSSLMKESRCLLDCSLPTEPLDHLDPVNYISASHTTALTYNNMLLDLSLTRASLEDNAIGAVEDFMACTEHADIVTEHTIVNTDTLVDTATAVPSDDVTMVTLASSEDASPLEKDVVQEVVQDDVADDDVTQQVVAELDNEVEQSAELDNEVEQSAELDNEVEQSAELDNEVEQSAELDNEVEQSESDDRLSDKSALTEEISEPKRASLSSIPEDGPVAHCSESDIAVMTPVQSKLIRRLSGTPGLLSPSVLGSIDEDELFAGCATPTAFFAVVESDKQLLMHSPQTPVHRYKKSSKAAKKIMTTMFEPPHHLTAARQPSPAKLAQPSPAKLAKPAHKTPEQVLYKHRPSAVMVPERKDVAASGPSLSSLREERRLASPGVITPIKGLNSPKVPWFPPSPNPNFSTTTPRSPFKTQRIQALQADTKVCTPPRVMNVKQSQPVVSTPPRPRVLNVAKSSTKVCQTPPRARNVKQSQPVVSTPPRPRVLNVAKSSTKVCQTPPKSLNPTMPKPKSQLATPKYALPESTNTVTPKLSEPSKRPDAAINSGLSKPRSLMKAASVLKPPTGLSKPLGLGLRPGLQKPASRLATRSAESLKKVVSPEEYGDENACPGLKATPCSNIKPTPTRPIKALGSLENVTPSSTQIKSSKSDSNIEQKRSRLQAPKRSGLKPPTSRLPRSSSYTDKH